jgi:hypothetical protein
MTERGAKSRTRKRGREGFAALVMALYFFNLSNGKEIADPDGHELASMDVVREAAFQAAQDWARKKQPSEIKGLYVSVTDGSGNEVFRTPLR